MRKIVVGGLAYFWSYSTVRDFYCKSKLTFITEKKDARFIVQFVTTDTPISGSPLNEGLRMMKDEKQYLVNFNQPKYVAEVLQYIINLNLDTIAKKVHQLNGNELLADMGYRDLDGFLV